MAKVYIEVNREAVRALLSDLARIKFFVKPNKWPNSLEKFVVMRSLRDEPHEIPIGQPTRETRILGKFREEQEAEEFLEAKINEWIAHQLTMLEATGCSSQS